MRQIRRNTFETNSSSSHSLVVIKDDIMNEMFDSKKDMFYSDTEIAKDMKWFYEFGSWEFGRYPFRVLKDFWEKFAYAYANGYTESELNAIVEELSPSCNKVKYRNTNIDDRNLDAWLRKLGITIKEFLSNKKYVVICDGDEYCVWNDLRESGVIDSNAIESNLGYYYGDNYDEDEES